MRHRPCCIALFLFAIPGLAAAEVYRWVDQNGRVQFGQTPPTQGTYDRVAPAPPPPGSSPNLDALREYTEAADKAREKSRQDAKKTEDQQARAQQRCSQAKQRAAYYESVGNLFSIDEKGQRTYLSSQQVDQRRADARATVQEHCQ